MKRIPPGYPACLALLVGFLAVEAPRVARAGAGSALLEEIVQQAIRQADDGAGALAKAQGRSVGRLFAREADDSLTVLARRADDLARSAGRLDEPAEAALRTRFARLSGTNTELARTFTALQPAEKRLVVEMAETAQRLARRYPGEAAPMIQRLGVDGLTAVRVYGDDVAEVIAKEGPESVNVLRRTGRVGWAFFTDKVLPNKGKLAAAGVVGLFLANPEKFVDTAGQATQYAIEQFAKAGIQLAGAVGGGAVRGLEAALGATLAEYGIDSEIARKAGMIAAVAVVILSIMALLGLPVRWALKPFTWPARALLGLRSRRAVGTSR